MAVYYNEIDIYAAQWLRNLIKAGHIPDGEVDTRSIVDVRPDDLRGFAQCHFFAGIAGWSHALRLAGWPDERPIWTGSCPCQPFSVAGKGKGTDDPRHLWPHFFRLIVACRPPTVMGEQVAGAAGYGWLDGVRSDLEGEGYACDGIDIPACAVNAPHIRQRLYWVARSLGDADGARADAYATKGASRAPIGERSGGSDVADADSPKRRAAAEGRRHDDDRQDPRRQEAPNRHQFHRAGDMVDADGRRCEPTRERPAVDGIHREWPDDRPPIAQRNPRSDVADTDDEGRQGRQLLPERPDELAPWSRGVEWRRGADGKERRVKSGVRLLASGISNRVGRLRAYGNAIAPPLAAKVVKAFMESEHGA